jgi:hypothetical protein
MLYPQGASFIPENKKIFSVHRLPRQKKMRPPEGGRTGLMIET